MSHPVDRKYDEYLASERSPHPFVEGGPFRVCLVYPNSYRVAMSNLGFQTVYRALNRIPGVTCERAFLPEAAHIRDMERYGTPIFSLETRRPLNQFQVIAFSVTYEMDYLNVFQILRMAGIAAASEERDPRDPLLLAGGAAITANPLPVSEIFDLFFLGEAEAGGPELFRRLQEAQGEDLEALTRDLPQVYVPSEDLAPPEEYPALPDLETDFAASSIITPLTVFSSTALVELTRGCPRRCSFCIAKDLYGATRNLSLETTLGYVESMRPYTDRFGLFGAGISDYDGIEKVVCALGEMGVEVTISSLRFDRLTPELLRVLRRGRQRSITVAPESFSQPVQRFLKKGFALRRVEEGLRLILDAGFERVKYYLMFGVPGEEPSDFEPLTEHLHKAIPDLERAGATLELSFSILEPKPKTALARLPMADRSTVRRTETFLRKNLPRSSRIEVQWPSYGQTCLSDWLSRGDRQAGRQLLRFHQETPRKPFRLPYREYSAEMGRILDDADSRPSIDRGTAVLSPAEPPPQLVKVNGGSGVTPQDPKYRSNRGAWPPTAISGPVVCPRIPVTSPPFSVRIPLPSRQRTW